PLLVALRRRVGRGDEGPCVHWPARVGGPRATRTRTDRWFHQHEPAQEGGRHPIANAAPHGWPCREASQERQSTHLDRWPPTQFGSLTMSTFLQRCLGAARLDGRVYEDVEA